MVICHRHIVEIEKGAIMVRKNANGMVCRHVHRLCIGTSLTAVLCINGLLSASCALTDEQQYHIDQRRGIWKTEFLDWQHSCHQAGGMVMVHSATDRDGVPSPGSFYACTVTVKRTH